MKYGIKVNLIVASVLAVSCVVSASLVGVKPAAAQAPNTDKKISLNFQNAPIQTVLKTLFSSVGANNSIDSDVQGNVNITMNDVNFEVALRSLLHAANPPLTYDYTDGVYHVRLKKQSVVPSGAVSSGATSTTTSPDTSYSTSSSSSSSGSTVSDKGRFYRLPIDHFDAASITRFLSGQPGIYIVNPTAGMQTSGGSGGGGLGGSSGGGGIGGIGGSSSGIGGGSSSGGRY